MICSVRPTQNGRTLFLLAPGSYFYTSPTRSGGLPLPTKKTVPYSLFSTTLSFVQSRPPGKKNRNNRFSKANFRLILLFSNKISRFFLCAKKSHPDENEHRSRKSRPTARTNFLRVAHNFSPRRASLENGDAHPIFPTSAQRTIFTAGTPLRIGPAGTRDAQVAPPASTPTASTVRQRIFIRRSPKPKTDETARKPEPPPLAPRMPGRAPDIRGNVPIAHRIFYTVRSTSFRAAPILKKTDGKPPDHPAPASLNYNPKFAEKRIAKKFFDNFIYFCRVLRIYVIRRT